MRRVWDVSGYCSADELGRGINIKAMVNYDKAELGSMVEKLAGDDARMRWINHGNNDTDRSFSDEDNNVNCNVGEDKATMQKADQ